MPKQTISQIVLAHADTLRTYTHSQLFQWSRDNGMDNRSAFSRFKEALTVIGVDYDALKEAKAEAKALDRAARVTHELTLITDASWSGKKGGRFAVCNASGSPIWYGRLFEDPGSAAHAELEAAKKAVWLAGKIREQVPGCDVLRLTLKTDAQALTYQDNRKQYGYVLTTMAEASRLILLVDHIDGATNPADRWSRDPGYAKYQDYDGLEALAVPTASSLVV